MVFNIPEYLIKFKILMNVHVTVILKISIYDFIILLFPF